MVRDARSKTRFRLATILAIGLGVLGMAIAWAFSTAPVPIDTTFALDLVTIRSAALEQSGPLPTHINVLEVAGGSKPLVTARSSGLARFASASIA